MYKKVNLNNNAANAYRTMQSVSKLESKKLAVSDAITSYFKSLGEDAVAIEIEKSGEIRVLDRRIKDKLDYLYSNLMIIFDELDVNPLLVYTKDNFPKDKYPKEGGEAALTAKIDKENAALKKTIDKRVSDSFNKEQWGEILKCLKFAVVHSDKCNHELVNIYAKVKKNSTIFDN